MYLKILNEKFECDKAIKGIDFIELYQNEQSIIKFSGISDFTNFEIIGGVWTIPKPTEIEILKSNVEYLKIIVEV